MSTTPTPAPVALILSDLHLARRAWTYRDVEGDSAHALAQAAAVCRERGVPLVLTGDVLDRRVNGSYAVSVLQEHLQDVQVHYLQGQHEMQDIPWCSLLPRATHVHQTSFRLGPLRCYGLDFQHREALLDSLAGVPEGTDVLFAHQVWGDWMGERANPQGWFAEVDHARVLVTGDLHKPVSQVVGGRGGRSFLAVSPGSACQQSIDEPPAKQALLLHADASLVAVPLDSRPVLRVSVASSAELDEAVATLPGRIASAADAAAGLPEPLRRPLVDVRADPALVVRGRLAEVTRGVAHLFLRPLAGSSRPADPAPDTGHPGGPVGAPTLAAMLADYLADQGESSLLPLCRRLLGSGDVAEELTTAHANKETI